MSSPLSSQINGRLPEIVRPNKWLQLEVADPYEASRVESQTAGGFDLARLRRAFGHMLADHV